MGINLRTFASGRRRGQDVAVVVLSFRIERARFSGLPPPLGLRPRGVIWHLLKASAGFRQASWFFDSTRKMQGMLQKLLPFLPADMECFTRAKNEEQQHASNIKDKIDFFGGGD